MTVASEPRGGDSLSHLEPYQQLLTKHQSEQTYEHVLLNLCILTVILTLKMSALESPPTLTPAWQDPWGMAMAGTVSPADFYDQNKAGQMTQAFYPHQPMVHGYPHHPMMDGQNNNNNSGSEGS